MLEQLVDRFMPGPFTKVLVSVVLVVALITTAFIWYSVRVNEAYRRGWDDAIAEVRKVDNQVADAASKARVTVDQCFDLGGNWDVSKGSCTFSK